MRKNQTDWEGKWLWVGTEGYCPDCAPDTCDPSSGTEYIPGTNLDVDYCCNCGRRNDDSGEIIPEENR
jgi:hypothetical protein